MKVIYGLAACLFLVGCSDNINHAQVEASRVACKDRGGVKIIYPMPTFASFSVKCKDGTEVKGSVEVELRIKEK